MNDENVLNFVVVSDSDFPFRTRSRRALIHHMESHNRPVDSTFPRKAHGCPKFAGMYGPFFDGGTVRYESWNVYKILST